MVDVPAYIRTFVPIVVMWLVSAAGDAGIVISDDLSTTMTVTIAGVVSAVYYAAVRWLGKRWPWAERLLGSAKSPSY